MKIGRVTSCCCFIAGMAWSASAVTLHIDRVRQRYPWNGLVDIDYTVTCADGGELGFDDDLELLMVDKSASSAVTNRLACFVQSSLPTTAGSHRITWDAHADGVTNRIDNAEFHCKVVHYSPYMVINVSAGSGGSAVYPVDFYGSEPDGGFNAPLYKGSNIVLRCIHPGVYVAGSPTDEVGRKSEREGQHRVVLTRPFYVGIFEITQRQYEFVMGSNPSQYTGEFRPVEYVSYNTIRGTGWPSSAAPSESSFMGNLLKKCRAKDADGNYTVSLKGLDLPTEFQWEYACRAGTTNAYGRTNDFPNTTEGQVAEMELLGRYSGNASKGEGGYSANHTTVGSYQPNGWGLYDMHGNVWEWCRDWHLDNVATLGQVVDPKGNTTGTERSRRGGGWGHDQTYCRSAFRASIAPDESRGRVDNTGFRLSLTLP